MAEGRKERNDKLWVSGWMDGWKIERNEGREKRSIAKDLFVCGRRCYLFVLRFIIIIIIIFSAMFSLRRRKKKGWKLLMDGRTVG